MAKAGFSKKPRTYIPKGRKGDTLPPTFSIRRLSPLEIMDINEKYSNGDETIELGEPAAQAAEKQDRSIKINLKTINKLVKSKYAIVEAALSGWENIEDELGEPIPFDKENVPCLDQDIINELADVAQGIVSEEEAKNSETPS